MIRRLGYHEVELAKADAVRIDRERLRDQLARMTLNENEGDELEQANRRGFNAALANVGRLWAP